MFKFNTTTNTEFGNLKVLKPLGSLRPRRFFREHFGKDLGGWENPKGLHAG